jgi:hypothetical protein
MAKRLSWRACSAQPAMCWQDNIQEARLGVNEVDTGEEGMEARRRVDKTTCAENASYRNLWSLINKNAISVCARHGARDKGRTACVLLQHQNSLIVIAGPPLASVNWTSQKRSIDSMLMYALNDWNEMDRTNVSSEWGIDCSAEHTKFRHTRHCCKYSQGEYSSDLLLFFHLRVNVVLFPWGAP